MAHQARFIPKFPQKYAGDPTRIFARSSWELYVMKFLDTQPSVIKWGSEELRIPYLKPVIVDGRATFKPANYFPDFVVVYRDKSGAIQKEILEIKPLKEATAESAKNNYDKLSLAVNMTKWKAAEDFAQRNGMKFRVVTERSLNFSQKPRSRVRRGAKVARAPRKAGEKS